MGFPGGSMVENPPANAGDMGLILGSERCLREGNGNPLQYSCLGNPTDREAWWVIVHGVARVGHNLATKQQQCEDDTEFFFPAYEGTRPYSVHICGYSSLESINSNRKESP